ncbi:MAG: Trm112 family protein [Verrucomicrobiota bacterium]|nr:Trm112 family protein [Verrucomicrobiota bacterium]
MKTDQKIMDEKLLELICCPETHQPLKLVNADLIAGLNQRIEAGTLVNRAGVKLEGKIDEGLIREDGKILYPVRQNIPTLLIEQGILIDQ